MASWLKKVFEELEKVTEDQIASAEPAERTSERDICVGVADAEIRKLYYLAKVRWQRAQIAKAELILIPPGQREEKMAEIGRLSLETQIFSDIFWISLQHAFPVLWQKASAGLRKDWNVVWSERPLSPLETMRSLLGDEMDEIPSEEEIEKMLSKKRHGKLH